MRKRTTRLDKPQGVNRYSVYSHYLTWRTGAADLGFPVSLKGVGRKPRAAQISGRPPQHGGGVASKESSHAVDPIHFTTSPLPGAGKTDFLTELTPNGPGYE